VELGHVSASQYSLRLTLLTDGGSYSSSTSYTTSDAPQELLVDWQSATAAGANNGTLRLYVDGVERTSLTGRDTDQQTIEHVRLGAVGSIDTGTSGTVYFDDFSSDRGPDGGAPTSTPTSTPIGPTATNTPIPPTATRTPTPAGPTATNTPIPPTNTPTNTPTSTPTSAGGSATSLFADGFESGNLSAWSSSVTGSGDLSVTSGAALVGSFGMQALINDTGGIYARDDSPSNETRYRARFRLDPNSVSIPSGNRFDILETRNSANGAVFRVELGHVSASQYSLRLTVLDDGGSYSSSASYTTSDAPQELLVDWQSATAAGANNGTIRLYVDGVERTSLTGRDTDGRRIEHVRLGAVGSIDTGTSGTLFFDQFQSWGGEGSIPPNGVSPDAVVAAAAPAAAPAVYLPLVGNGQPVAAPAPDLAAQVVTLQTRTLTYGYDGLQRLTSAVESGFSANSYAYGYDRAGNRLSATQNGATTSRSYDAANQVVGWSYDAAGNLLSEGATSYAYDALSRVTSSTRAGVVTTNSYNADGTLVAQTSGETTRYAQDLASPLSQVLRSDGTNYLYGLERLGAQSGGVTTWYVSDALGSLRQTIDNAGNPTARASYDPWGTPQGSSLAPFGFTGELQDAAGLTYLRARWYTPGAGTFTSRDSFAGISEQPYSLHSYQYALSNPVTLLDPTGECATWILGDPNCQFIGWDRIQAGDLEWEDGRAWGGAAVDFTPGVGDIKGLIEAFTGCDIVTGEDLGNWRWLGLLGVSELRNLRHADIIPTRQTRNSVSPTGHYGGGVFSADQKYPYDPREAVVGQVNEASCADAACRMLASTAGSTITRELREGASIEEMRSALIDSSVPVMRTTARRAGDLREYLRRGPVIVGLPVGMYSRHAIVIDSIDNDMVYIRDPLPTPRGSAYAVSIDTFNDVMLFGSSPEMTVLYLN
jgi:RHS repeat-associated protein